MMVHYALLLVLIKVNVLDRFNELIFFADLIIIRANVFPIFDSDFHPSHHIVISFT